MRGNLQDRLAAKNHICGDSGLEFKTMGAALAHELEPRFQGRYPASEVNHVACRKKPDQDGFRRS